MDILTILIGFLLVFTGAAFFGYPIGLMIGKRGWCESFDFERRDALDAEYLEEVKRC